MATIIPVHTTVTRCFRWWDVCALIAWATHVEKQLLFGLLFKFLYNSLILCTDEIQSKTNCTKPYSLHAWHQQSTKDYGAVNIRMKTVTVSSGLTCQLIVTHCKESAPRASVSTSTQVITRDFKYVGTKGRYTWIIETDLSIIKVLVDLCSTQITKGEILGVRRIFMSYKY